MFGFAAGLGQGFGNFANDLSRDRFMREELDLKKAAAFQAKKLEQTKQVGDLVKSFNDALSVIPNEDTPEAAALAAQRTDMFAAEFEALTGQKIDPIALKIIKQGGKKAADAMAQIYGENPARFGPALTNMHAFTAVFDAYNARNFRIQSGEAFKSALGGGAPGAAQLDQTLPPQVVAIDQRMAALNNAASRLNINSDLGKQQNDLIQKNLDILQKQRDQLLTGSTARMTRDEQPMSFQEAQAARVPVGTTYGEFRRMRGGGAPATTQPVAPQSAVQGAPLGIRNNNPGNLRPVGSSSGFQQFATPEAGLAALDKNLQVYGSKHGINTIQGVINRWAPSSENNTKAYVDSVSKRLGIPATQKIDLGNPMVRQALSTAIMLHENGAQGVFGQPAAQPVAEVAPAASALPGVPKTAATLAQEETIAKGGGETFNQMRTLYGEAIQDERRMKQLGSLLSNIDTGAAAPLTLSVQRGLQAAGFNIDPKWSQAEAAKALAIQMLGQTRKEAGGVGATSNYENSIYAAGQAGIDKLPGANKILVSAAIKSAQRTQKTFKEVAKYVKENGYDDVAIAEIVARNQEENPIFTPEDAQYLTGGKSVVKKDGRPPIESFFK